MKVEPKTKRSYGKRKSISVPELLAVRVEMTSEEAANSKTDQDIGSVDAIAPLECEKIEPISIDNVEYDVTGAQETSVYEEVQEIDWTEHNEQSHAKVKTIVLNIDASTEHFTPAVATNHGFAS